VCVYLHALRCMCICVDTYVCAILTNMDAGSTACLVYTYMHVYIHICICFDDGSTACADHIGGYSV